MPSNRHRTPGVGDVAEPFTLDDQFHQSHDVAFGDGQPVVIVFADRGSTSDVEPWARALSARLGPRARVLGVAAVGGVPEFLQGAVRGFLQGAPSVLIDWGNRVSDRLGYAGGGCLVVAVDGGGVVRARVEGALTDARYAEIAAALDAS